MLLAVCSCFLADSIDGSAADHVTEVLLSLAMQDFISSCVMMLGTHQHAIHHQHAMRQRPLFCDVPGVAVRNVGATLGLKRIEVCLNTLQQAASTNVIEPRTAHCRRMSAMQQSHHENHCCGVATRLLSQRHIPSHLAVLHILYYSTHLQDSKQSYVLQAVICATTSHMCYNQSYMPWSITLLASPCYHYAIAALACAVV